MHLTLSSNDREDLFSTLPPTKTRRACHHTSIISFTNGSYRSEDASIHMTLGDSLPIIKSQGDGFSNRKRNDTLLNFASVPMEG